MRLPPIRASHIRLLNGLRVSVYRHPGIPADRAALALHIPFGTRHDPSRDIGSVAAVAHYLGTLPDCAEGGLWSPVDVHHEFLLAPVAGSGAPADVLPALDRHLWSRLCRVHPGHEEAVAGGLWEATKAWRDALVRTEDVQAMNLAHATLYRTRTPLFRAWPYGVVDSPWTSEPSRPPRPETLRRVWRLINPATATLMVALNAEADFDVETWLRRSLLARWSPPAAVTFKTRAGIPFAVMHTQTCWRAKELRAPVAGNKALAVVCIPCVPQTHGAVALAPWVSRLGPLDGEVDVHCGFWPHPDRSLLAAWAFFDPAALNGGAVVPVALGRAIDRLRHPRTHVTNVQHVRYAIERDMRRVVRDPIAVLRWEARYVGFGAPPAPPYVIEHNVLHGGLRALSTPQGIVRGGFAHDASLTVDADGLRSGLLELARRYTPRRTP